MKYSNFDIVFQEVPGEVTLALNLSGCRNACPGCHSPHLQSDTGDELTEHVLQDLLNTYGNAITCVCFMGGDHAPDEVTRLAKFARTYTTTNSKPCKTAWYSGKSKLHENAQLYFDYVKLGPYIESLGGLDSPQTNQRFYKIENGAMTDMTVFFELRINK